MRGEDLQRHVAAELFWDPRVDSEAIEASAGGGTVTLRGSVASLRLKRAGGRAAARIRGVTWVANELRVQLPEADRLTQAPDARDAADAISGAFRRDAVLAAAVLSVETSCGGLVILSGMVSSWAAHDHAVAAAWSAPGVTQVKDRIGVQSSP